MNQRVVFGLAACVALAFCGGAARAQNLFVITGTSNGTPITPVGADNLVDLVTAAVNDEGSFASLAGTNASLSLNYGGVANAITVDKDATNTNATLTFLNPDGSRTTRTFNSANGALEDQIRDYLQADGAADLASFFQAMNALSVIAVSDGNPNATTARMADNTFDRFGRFNRQSAMYLVSGDDPKRTGAGAQLRIGASGSAFSAGDFDGTSATLAGSLDWNFSPVVGASLGSFVGYTSIGDANVFHLGIHLGVPIRPVLPDEKLPLTWQITPSFSMAGSGSEEVAAGGLVYSGAVTSLLRWDVNKKFALELANQWGFYEGQELSFGDYTIDPGVSQSILKNGLHAELAIGDGGWYAYGGASYTSFLEDAAVEGYLTPALGLGWRKSPFSGTSLEIGFSGDFGEDYSSYGGRVGFNLAF